jgi:hypothetical protein
MIYVYKKLGQIFLQYNKGLTPAFCAAEYYQRACSLRALDLHSGFCHRVFHQERLFA